MSATTASPLKLAQPIRSRSDIPGILTQLGLTGWGVEVGVDSGVYSAQLLAGSQLRRLFSVDPWAAEELGGIDDYPYEGMLRALATLRPFGLRSVVMRMRSLDAVEVFQDGALDFVYLDGIHRVPGVDLDIAAWYPKIRKGGILSGHDYEPWNPSPHVRTAVDAFAAHRGLSVVVTELDSMDHGHDRHSWMIQVPS
jgi:hypothetical protein